MELDEMKELKLRLKKRAKLFNEEIRRLSQRLDTAIELYEGEIEQLKLSSRGKTDDTIYFPQNDFEWEMKEEKGMPFFRRYRQQLEIDKRKERDVNMSYKMR
jgi:hypothetical protein